VLWPPTTTKTTSEPLCVGENKEPIYRECLDGKWGPEPQCYNIQPKVPPQCPENYTDAGTFCYTMSEKSTFPPFCLYKDVLPFNTYKSVITEPVWMPIQRDVSEGLSFFKWIEISPLYLRDFEGNYTYSGGIKDKNCLVYHNESYIVAV